MTLTMIAGLVVALLWAEVTGLVPGGLIVPAYMALYLEQPWRVAATLGSALLALGLYRLLGRYFLLFGRRRFVLLLLLGALIGQGWTLVWPGLFAAPVDLRVIGWVIPGLLANNLQRQKFWLTLASLGAASVLTWAAVKLLGIVF